MNIKTRPKKILDSFADEATRSRADARYFAKEAMNKKKKAKDSPLFNKTKPPSEGRRRQANKDLRRVFY